MFDEFMVQFAPGSQAVVMDFQLSEDISTLPVIQAKVALDTLAEQGPLQQRGTPQLNRILLLKADRLDVHLEIVDSDGITSLLGQVLEKSTSQFLTEVEVRLLKAQRTIEVRAADNLGEFRFSSVPKGPLSLEILIRPQRQRIIGEIAI
jgi:hypothetical protein